MKIKLDHVGWVTNNLDLFEKFWVRILGFEKIFESTIKPEMNYALFNYAVGAYCARYSKDDMTIEVHQYNSRTAPRNMNFQVFGINHIALHVEDRKEFLEKHNFTKHVYHNPKGWDNIFIEDFEGNWIELRETLK